MPVSAGDPAPSVGQQQQQQQASEHGVTISGQEQQQQPAPTSSTSSFASRILGPFLRFASSPSAAVPSGLPPSTVSQGLTGSDKACNNSMPTSGLASSADHAEQVHHDNDAEQSQTQQTLAARSHHAPGMGGGDPKSPRSGSNAPDCSVVQPDVAHDDQPVLHQTTPLGVTEFLLLETLARTISAKATWSNAVSAAQTTAASLNLTDPVPPTSVVLELECDDPWSQPDAIRQVEAVIRPDIFMSVSSAAKTVDHAATVFVRMLNKYRLANAMADALQLCSIDPMPWQSISLHVLREHLVAHFNDQPVRIPFNGFCRPIASAAAPAGAPDSNVNMTVVTDVDGASGENEPSAHQRCASFASDASSGSSCASPNVRRLGSGLVGSSMPTPALLTSRESHLDRRPTSLVNYNNSSTARNKYISPPNSTVAINHPDAHLLIRTATPVARASSPVSHVRPQTPVQGLHARVAHPKPRKLTLSIPDARSAPRPAPAEFSPLIFDKNRYIRPGGAPVALHSDSPLATPLPSPGPSSSANMGIALPAAAANAGLLLADEVMRAMAANGAAAGRLSRPTSPLHAHAQGATGLSAGQAGQEAGASSNTSSKSQAV